MSLTAILLGAVALGCAVIACVAVVRAVSGGRPVRDRHGLGHQLAGMLAGVALACMALVAVGEHREPILSLAPLAGSCWLVGLIVAECRRDRPSLGPLRVAGLGPRTAGGIVSRHALAAMRGTFVITAGLAVLAILLASDKDARSYAQACVDGTTSTTGVWPGAPYAVPALLALGLGWTMAEWAIRSVVRRPPGTGRPPDDNGRRILAARTAVTAGMLLALPTLALLLVSMGARLHGTCPTAAESALGVGMLAAGGVLALVSAGSWVAALLSGGRSIVPRVLE